MRRRWQVWALYDEPELWRRCWTRHGAERAALYAWLYATPGRWLDFEVRREATR